jgi:hypothetical protein
MSDTVIMVLVLLLCVGFTKEPGFPDIGDGIGGSVAISGFPVTGIKPCCVKGRIKKRVFRDPFSFYRRSDY